MSRKLTVKEFDGFKIAQQIAADGEGKSLWFCKDWFSYGPTASYYEVRYKDRKHPIRWDCFTDAVQAYNVAE